MTDPLDSRQLRAFAALMRTGSFTHAARDLHHSQSAVSHSMKALENDVGCRLLDRMGKTVILTQAGEQLFAHAQKILSAQGIGEARVGYEHSRTMGGPKGINGRFIEGAAIGAREIAAALGHSHANINNLPHPPLHLGGYESGHGGGATSLGPAGRFRR